VGVNEGVCGRVGVELGVRVTVGVRVMVGVRVTVEVAGGGGAVGKNLGSGALPEYA